jgi:hypothetical protein
VRERERERERRNTYRRESNASCGSDFAYAEVTLVYDTMQTCDIRVRELITESMSNFESFGTFGSVNACRDALELPHPHLV